jgi:hypothetical protein
MSIRSSDPFIKAYYDFKESVDFSRNGILPDLDNMVDYLIMGVPRVPADDNFTGEFSTEAIDQRIAILKAVFAELNHDATEEFLDEGLKIYDQAGKRVKVLLREIDGQTDVE